MPMIRLWVLWFPPPFFSVRSLPFCPSS
jgi:hypothetical protein